MRRVVVFAVRIKACQAQCHAGRVDKGRHPANLTQTSQRPVKGQQSRCDTEAHHVGEAVILGAKSAIGSSQARNTTIQAIKDHCHENGHRASVEVALHARNDRVETAEQGSRGEEVRQQENALRLCGRV